MGSASKTIIYRNNLSVKQNAEANGCSEATIRRYIRINQIDRKYDEQLIKYKTVKAYQKKDPLASAYAIAKITGYSNATVRKYMQMDVFYAKSCSQKLSTFDMGNNVLIKSVSNTQDEILASILKLYIPTNIFDCDLTYSQGAFYRNIPQPNHKFDKYPISPDVLPLDTITPDTTNCYESIVIDLPFIVKSSDKEKQGSKIANRFQSFDSPKELLDTNKDMIVLANRLLKAGGYLVMKTQNINYAGQQIWVHRHIMNCADAIGLKMVDEFVYAAKSRTIYHTAGEQRHSRKYHSYFLIFQKPRRNRNTSVAYI